MNTIDLIDRIVHDECWYEGEIASLAGRLELDPVALSADFKKWIVTVPYSYSDGMRIVKDAVISGDPLPWKSKKLIYQHQDLLLRCAIREAARKLAA